MTIKGKTLSFVFKIIAGVLVVVATILGMAGVRIKMKEQVLPAAIFLSTSCFMVDISKVKAAGRFPAKNKEEL